MRRYSLEPRKRKYFKGYEFLSFARKYEKQFLDTDLNAVKIASKRAIHKVVEFFGK